MKTLTLLLAILLFTITVQAKTYIIGSGKWSDASIWGGEYMGSVIKIGDSVIVTGQITMNTAIVVEGTLVVGKGATMSGMKDLTVTPKGVFVNNGNTVVKRILNAGSIQNNMIMEAMMDIENRSSIVNNNAMITGNNFDNIEGTAAGDKGSYLINNKINASPSSILNSNVRVFTGSITENQPVTCE